MSNMYRSNGNREEQKQEIEYEDAVSGDSNEGDRPNMLQSPKHPSILPAVTPEIINQHLADQEAAKRRRPEDEEPGSCFGIPYYLFMILVALGAAVLAGTVLAVIYYDPDAGVQPPSLSPTSMDANNATDMEP